MKDAAKELAKLVMKLNGQVVPLALKGKLIYQVGGDDFSLLVEWARAVLELPPEVLSFSDAARAIRAKDIAERAAAEARAAVAERRLVESGDCYVEIVERTTGKAAKRMGPHPKWKAERIGDGASRNLDHDRFFVQVVDAKGGVQ